MRWTGVGGASPLGTVSPPATSADTPSRSAPSLSASPGLEVGARVQVRALTGTPVHNGKQGTLQEFLPASGRWRVMLDGLHTTTAPIAGKLELALKPGNLELVSAPSRQQRLEEFSKTILECGAREDAVGMVALQQAMEEQGFSFSELERHGHDDAREAPYSYPPFEAFRSEQVSTQAKLMALMNARDYTGAREMMPQVVAMAKEFQVMGDD